MDLPVLPPLQPMLARAARELPSGDTRYEPKWDGFRCLAFRDGAAVDLRSRHDRPLGRYFPELVEGLAAIDEPRFVLDGEIVPAGRGGFDFAGLMSRLHPAASRVERLRRELPAAYVAFDLLARGADDLRPRPAIQRRAALEALLAGAPAPILLTPTTRDPEAAARWLELQGGGVDGIVAKPDGDPYLPGRRTMTKVKRERTADCVLAGARLLPSGGVSSLLLGLYDEDDALRHVGVVTAFPAAERRALAAELVSLTIPLARHPWRDGFLIGRSPIGRLRGSAGRWTPDMEHDWWPLRPERVLEVAFDQVDVDRFRHPARFRRWRPDREPASCRMDQIELGTVDLGRVLGAA